MRKPFPPSRSHRGPRQRQQGVALILVLIALTVLSLLATLLVVISNTGAHTTTNQQALTEAHYAAEAGTQAVADWLFNTYTAPTSTTGFNATTSPVDVQGSPSPEPVVLSVINGTASTYPDEEQGTAWQNSFSQAFSNYTVGTIPVSVSATLLSLDPSSQGYVMTWQIKSVAAVPGAIGATSQVITSVQQEGQAGPKFSYAVYTTSKNCNALQMTGNDKTGSFNSSQEEDGEPDVSYSGGNVGSNGGMDLTGHAIIYGSYGTPPAPADPCSPTLTTVGAAGVSGGTNTISPPSYPLPDITVPAGSPDVADSGSGTYNLSPGDYNSVTMSGNETLMLSSGTYNINTMALSGGVSLAVDITSGPVILNISNTGSLAMSGNSVINGTGIPTNFQINYAGTGNISLSGDSKAFATVYAPDANVVMNGNSDWYGAVIAGTFADVGNAGVYYDSSLGNANNGGNNNWQYCLLTGFQ